jgi:UDP-2,3-diacylglucosamine pyrophosphatase LpxH
MKRKKSYFVSDLHLFSRRSLAMRHAEALGEAAGKAHTFVLGGDIFDFRWTTLASVEHTIDAAVKWLDKLVSAHPQCEFHFVLGNHDSNERFVARLAQLSAGTPNLSWHPYYVRLGSGLFLHGDAADRKMTPESLARARSKCLVDKKRGKTANLLYDLAVRARLHKAVMHVAKPRQLVAKRIHAYAQRIGHGPESGLKNVYFGHTHAALSNYRYGGLTFHNPGAPMEGLEFQIVETDVRNGD